jgi:hypothetical protein
MITEKADTSSAARQRHLVPQIPHPHPRHRVPDAVRHEVTLRRAGTYGSKVRARPRGSRISSASRRQGGGAIARRRRALPRFRQHPGNATVVSEKGKQAFPGRGAARCAAEPGQDHNTRSRNPQSGRTISNMASGRISK